MNPFSSLFHLSAAPCGIFIYDQSVPHIVVEDFSCFPYCSFISNVYIPHS